jgi:two-component system, OmpR family, alkaline phosphatase synthesis response regulator PhoP
MNPPRVLIIEDEANIRHTMQMALEAAGYEVGTAVDGEEGLRCFQQGGHWSLVLLDQRMPGMSGEEVLRLINAEDRVTPVVLITAYGTVNLAADVLRLGAAGFLRKPFTPEELRGVVRDMLATWGPAHGET